MKIIPFLAVLMAVTLAGPGVLRSNAAEEDGVALAIIYDTSGSMKDPVPDQSGNSAPKYVIANRALLDITRQIEAFATNNAAHRKVESGLFVFKGNNAREAVKFGPFDPAAFSHWAKHFSNPTGNTPLGNALSTAGQAVLQSPLSHKHVLVITDGMNTAGPTPTTTLPQLQQQAQSNHATLSVHFIAFDVDAKVFAPLKKLGASVVGAADEKQLNSQLQFILQHKILLEDEEPKKQ
jgi:hypothetical protein